MLCTNPFVRDPTGKVFKVALVSDNPDLAINGIPFPCGQCLACQINKRRVWTHRLMLEGLMHGDACFLTLTYSSEHLPEDNSISKREVQLFLKKLRKAWPEKIRYYACGEYGGMYGRPHYHLILFGVPASLGKEWFEKIWQKGLCDVHEFNQYTAQYVAGYVTKKIIRKGDTRQKEFALMSNRPGLGLPALGEVVKIYKDPKYKDLFTGDNFPSGLRFGPTVWPFGRYLSTKLEDFLERSRDLMPFIREMREKYLKAYKSDKYFGDYLSNYLIDESRQKNLQIAAIAKMYRYRGALS